MRLATLTLIFSGALLLCASGATAEGPPPEYAREGGYLGLSFASAPGFAREAAADVDGLKIDPGWGFSTFLGWRHSEHIASEIQLEYIHQRTTQEPGDSTDAFDFLASFNLKVPILTGRIQPYGLAGLGLIYTNLGGVLSDGTRVSADNTQFMTRLGVGLDFYVTNHWVVSSEATYILAPGERDVDMLSLGLGAQYRF